MDFTRKENKKTNVLYLTVGLTCGGAEKLIFDLASRLDPNRYQVSVVALKSWGPIGDMLKARGIPAIALGSQGLWDLAALLKAYRILRKSHFAIVHSHLYGANMVAALLKGRFKLIWHVHEIGAWMKNPIWAFIERFLSSRADKVLAISEAARTQFLNRVPGAREKTELLFNGVAVSKDVSLEKSDKDRLKKNLFGFSGRPVVGYVGRLDADVKGLDILVQAARIVTTELPQVAFILIGGGSDRGKLEQLAKKEGAENQVLFLGEKVQLKDYYLAFDVFVLPSRAEGLGIALLEAMDACLPVVSTLVGGIPEVVENEKTGLLVPPQNPEKLAQAILTLLKSPDLAAKFGLEGKERLKGCFDINFTVQTVDNTYSNLLK